MASSGRHLARRNAVQALYQWDMTGQAAERIKTDFILDERLTGRHLEYFDKIIKQLPLNIEQIDEALEESTDRSVNKLDPLVKAVLRVGMYEILYEIDVPHNVVINEAIEIAKLFCSDQGFKYVNGVLDKVVKAKRKASV